MTRAGQLLALWVLGVGCMGEGASDLFSTTDIVFLLQYPPPSSPESDCDSVTDYTKFFQNFGIFWPGEISDFICSYPRLHLSYPSLL